MDNIFWEVRPESVFEEVEGKVIRAREERQDYRERPGIGMPHTPDMILVPSIFLHEEETVHFLACYSPLLVEDKTIKEENRVK